MALKVVPAGDERCDIHNRRTPATHICETCLKEFGIESGRRATTPRAPRRVRARRALRPARARRTLRRWRPRIDRKVLTGVKIGLPIAAVILVIVLVAGGGDGGDGDGGGNGGGGRSEADVVNALDLVPDASGTSWATADGACTVVSIEFGPEVQAGPVAGNLVVEVTNEDATVGAVVAQRDFSISEADCAARVDAALKARF